MKVKWSSTQNPASFNPTENGATFDLVNELREEAECYRGKTRDRLLAAADRIEAQYRRNKELEAALTPLLTATELKLVEKNCDWVAFQHAFSALMKSRRAALAGEKKDDPT
jgi:hypothetical protein